MDLKRNFVRLLSNEYRCYNAYNDKYRKTGI